MPAPKLPPKEHRPIRRRVFRKISPLPTVPEPRSATPYAMNNEPSGPPTAVNTRGETVSRQTGTFYNPDTNEFEQRTVYR